MSIRARFFFLVLLATLLPAVFLGIRFFLDRANAVESALASLSSTATSIVADLDEKILGTAQLHFGLARARDLENPNRAACSEFLAAVLAEHPQYTGILTINPDGALFCDSLRTGRNLDLTDRGYFRKALSVKQGVTLEATFGRLTGLSVLQIAYPARSESGELQFVLLASFNLSKFAEDHNLRLADTEIIFFDKDGTVLAWTPAGIMSSRNGTSIAGDGLFTLATAPDGARVAEVAGDKDSQAWIAAASTSSLHDIGLHVVVRVLKSDLYADANRNLLLSLGILAVVSVLLFVGVWMLAELGIRRPTGRIAEMATRLGLGDLSARIAAPHPKGELGGLMTALNRAAESLEAQRASIAELNQKLLRSQKLEVIGQLTGGVAHDFNNLLTVILGNAELLADKLSGDARLRALAEMTLKAAEQGAELTSRLLAFARRQPLDPRPTDINGQVAGMEPLLHRTLNEQIEIEVKPATGLWKAMIDAGQLENAILNLCINARDAMPNGGRLTVETQNVQLDADYAARETEVEPGQYVMLAVSDTGTGMDKATLEHAFEPFFTTKEMGKGSGLGLSMVFGFVKQSRGHIRLYSEPGHGTTVKLYLPRADSDGDAKDGRRDERAAATGTEKILLVEDNDMVRGHVSAQLQSLGYNVLSVNNGLKAIEALKMAGDFDLLFTDVVMPGGIGGRMLAEEARKLRPALPVLFTSGYTENAVVHHGRLDAGVHLLQKPFRRNELAAKVREVLDKELVD